VRLVSYSSPTDDCWLRTDDGRQQTARHRRPGRRRWCCRRPGRVAL